MLQFLIIFAIVFVSIFALRGSWRIAARWGLFFAITAVGLILAANLLTLWYGILPKAEVAIRNLGGPTEPHLLKAIAVPVAILLYSVVGGAVRRLILAMLAGRKLTFVLGLAALYSLMQVFFAVADSKAPLIIRLPIRPPAAVSRPPTKASSEGTVSKLVGQRERDMPAATGAGVDRKGQGALNARAVNPATARRPDPPSQAADQMFLFPYSTANPPRTKTTLEAKAQAGQASVDHDVEIPAKADPTIIIPSRRSVALAVDSTGFEDADWIADSLRDYLSVSHKVRVVAEIPRGSVFFDGVNSDGQILQAMNSSRADYLLIAKARISFRRYPEVDSDFITCEMVLAVRLVDRHGAVLRSGVFSAAGPGFSRAQAFNGAAERAARQIANNVLATVP